jgi:hypothetical protein
VIPLFPENELTSDVLNGLYQNAVFYDLALVLTAVIQTLQKQLDLYHTISVMQIILSLHSIHSYGMLLAHSIVILKSPDEVRECRYENVRAGFQHSF